MLFWAKRTFRVDSLAFGGLKGRRKQLHKKHHQKASAKPILADCFKRRGEEHAPEKLRRLRFLLGWKKMTPKSWNAVETKHTKHRKNSRIFFGGGVFVFKSIIIQWAMAVQKHHSRNSHLGCRTIPNLHPEGGPRWRPCAFFSVKKLRSICKMGPCQL